MKSEKTPCFSLRAQAIVICSIVMCVTLFTTVTENLGYLDTSNNYEEKFIRNYGVNRDDFENGPLIEKMNSERKGRLFEKTCELIFLCFLSILSLMLLLGVLMRKPGLMIPGLVLTGSLLFANVMATFSNAWDRGITGPVFRQICLWSIVYYAVVILISYYSKLTTAKAFNELNQSIEREETSAGVYDKLETADINYKLANGKSDNIV